MQYVYHFDISAIILTAMLIVIVYTRKAYPTKSFKCYIIMLWLNLIASSADLFSSFTLTNTSLYPLWLNYAVNIIYLISHNLTAVMFLLFIIAVIRGNYGILIEKIFLIVISVVIVGLVISTPWTGLIFSFNENLEYMHGVCMAVLYALAFLTLLYAFILFLVYRKRLTAFQMFTDIVFLSLILIAIVFQYFFPEILIESFVISITFMMTHFSLDNPSIYLYRNTYCYNQNAFNHTIEERLNYKEDFKILAFTFRDFTELRKKYGYDFSYEIIDKVLDIGLKAYGQKRFYVLNNYIFAIELLNDDIHESVAKINKLLRDNIDFYDKKISLVPNYCFIHNSNDINTLGEVNDAMETMLFEIYKKTGETIIYDSSKDLDEHRRENEVVRFLREAILNDGFEIYYQPILDYKTRKYVCAEALVRLKKIDGINIFPDEFIPIAEKNGIISDIGEIVLEKVCRFFRDANLKIYGIKYLNINLSVSQIAEIGIGSLIDEYCKRYCLSPENINLEITETAMTSDEDFDIISKNVKDLIDKGYNFSLDDYGSGYSTAMYFAKIPFNNVKIDKGILWSAMEDETFNSVLENTIRGIKRVGRNCVVEGIENKKMEEKLIKMGCDMMQGYLYSKPLSEDEFINFVSEKNGIKINNS
ncbi:MAG: EAL domain-containing protein [Firmicutes bacterium]|nr:EAL domain-containing protein [Candidatus Caballimonas caccae]